MLNMNVNLVITISLCVHVRDCKLLVRCNHFKMVIPQQHHSEIIVSISFGLHIHIYANFQLESFDQSSKLVIY